MDKTPDSWDQATGLSGLSISAKPFVPNINAAVFVPTFTTTTSPLPPESVSAVKDQPAVVGSTPEPIENGTDGEIFCFI